MKAWKRLPGVVGITALTAFAAQADLFSAGFEPGDTPSYTVGQQLHTTGGGTYWNWSGANIGTISDDPGAVYAGSQGLDATRSTTANSQLWWTRPTAFFPGGERGGIRQFGRPHHWLDQLAGQLPRNGRLRHHGR